MTIEQKIMQLAAERSRATELAAATARFIADWEGVEDSATLRDLSERTLDAAFDAIASITERIKIIKGTNK